MFLLFRAQGGVQEYVRFWMATVKMSDSSADRELLFMWYEANRYLLRFVVLHFYISQW